MFKAIKILFRKLGYSLAPLSKPVKKGDFTYSLLNTTSTYSPWFDDKTYLQAYELIKEKTLVDNFRCYELFQLAQNAIRLNPNAAMIEIGVWRGGTAGILSSAITSLKSNAHLYLADTFSGVVKTSVKDTFYVGGEHFDTSEEIVKDLLENKIKFNNFSILKGIFPDETGKLIPLNTIFSLCHVDVDVYLSAKDIVEWIFSKMLVGGIIVFDDYGFESCDGVTKFVNEQRSLKDRIVLHNLNGHAILIKVS